MKKMKSKMRSILAIIAVVAVIGFSFIACGGDDGTTPTPNSKPPNSSPSPTPQSVTYVSKDSGGNLYTLEITEDTGGTSRYVTKQGDSFKLTVELYNDGEYTLALSYTGRIGSTTAKGGTEIEINITVNSKPLTITINGTNMTVISGTIDLDEGGTLSNTAPLTPIETPEDLPDVKRWQSWTDSSATATITYSVDKNDVCTIIIGGIPQANNNTDNWGKWKAQAIYGYTAKTNTRYAYEFEAWTDSDERILGVQYYGNNDDGVYLGYDIMLTRTRKTFTIFGDAIPKNNSQYTKLIFSGADQLGKFYLKILSIEEYEESNRWWKYVSNTSTATLDYSVANDGVCNITVGGTAQKWDKWKAQAGYVYNANAGTPYEYVFEAWTDSGTRTVNVQYYGNNDDGVYLSRDIILTTEQTTFTIYGDGIPKIGAGTNINLIFQCADQIGKFYVKIISIKKPIAWNSSGNYDYIEYASTVFITDYNGSGGALTIPGGFNGKPIGAIGNRAFCGKQLTGSISIPNTVIFIGDWAFEDNQLNNVTFAATSKVTAIGESAFAKNQLTSVTIPNSVSYIGVEAFSENRLSSVTFATNGKLATIGGNAFFVNQLTSVTIPNSVTQIGWGAFNENQLTSVTIGSGVTDIGDWAFHHNRLTSVTIPNSVESIWNNAFANNPLTSVTIGANVTLHQGEDEFIYVFPGNFDNVYNNGGKTAGTYKGVLAQNDEEYENTSWSKN